ncbi:MAG TPA: VOC family protein [Chitinophagaceae bacterium]|nr:VOC family protein [Chitinophagaceae bacterium]HEX5652689.1 VOC family protein [Chitinophagaceae bacterium]
MHIEHVAIWTNDLEKLKDFYCRYFGAVANEKYSNPRKNFESYFLGFPSGARLEIMKMNGVPSNANDTVKHQHLGLIHIAFGAGSKEEVENKSVELESNGFPILSGPRFTGDGYFEFETLDPDNNRIEVSWKPG